MVSFVACSYVSHNGHEKMSLDHLGMVEDAGEVTTDQLRLSQTA